MNASKKVFITDCEGPISKNDNAYELTANFVPNGAELFALISKYDDVQADVVKRRGYKAGDTLRLILPFLKAHEVTNRKIKEFSSENILLIPNAKDTLQFVKDIMPSFIVSTSYEQYMQALCGLVNFPFENVYCTRLDIDKYQMSEEEKERLKHLRDEIVAMPMVEIPKKTTGLGDFSEKDKKIVKRLDEIFWQEIAAMEIGRMLQEVNPIGGLEKTRAIEEIVAKVGVEIGDVMYVGDSITDVQSLQLVKANNGLTVSFNGNSYAVREAEIAVLSHDTTVTSILAEVFCRYGKRDILELTKEWSIQALKKYCSQTLQKQVSCSYPEGLPKVEIITSANKERLMKESSAFRKTVRGRAVGGLG